MEAPEIRYAWTRDGVRIGYALFEGDGVPVFNLQWPGANGAATGHMNETSAGCFNAMRGERPGVRFDYRGTGYSGPIGGHLTIEEQALDIEAVLDAVGEPVDVVSWCTASFAVTQLLVRRPELARTVTFVAPDYEGCDSHYAALWELRDQIPYAAWAEIIIRRGFDASPAESQVLVGLWEEFLPDAATRAHMLAFLQGSLAETLPQLCMPVAVIGDRNSREQAAQVAAAVPRSVFRTLDGAYVGRRVGLFIRETMEALQTGSLPPPRNGSNSTGNLSPARPTSSRISPPATPTPPSPPISPSVRRPSPATLPTSTPSSTSTTAPRPPTGRETMECCDGTAERPLHAHRRWGPDRLRDLSGEPPAAPNGVTMIAP